MKDRVVQIAFIALCLVLGAATQELFPPFGGAKAPVLALLALHAAFRRDDEQRAGGAESPSCRWIAIAFAAGTFEDALNGFDTPCCTLFTLFACTSGRLARPMVEGLPNMVIGCAAAMIVAPLHELWLSVWGVFGLNALLVVRFCASALPAAVVGTALFAVLPRLERMIGFYDLETERRMR